MRIALTLLFLALAAAAQASGRYAKRIGPLFARRGCPAAAAGRRHRSRLPPQLPCAAARVATQEWHPVAGAAHRICHLFYTHPRSLRQAGAAAAPAPAPAEPLAPAPSPAGMVDVEAGMVDVQADVVQVEAVLPAEGAAIVLTAEEVAKHNTAEDCWCVPLWVLCLAGG